MSELIVRRIGRVLTELNRLPGMCNGRPDPPRARAYLLDGWLDGIFDAANVEDLIRPSSGCGVAWRDSGRGRNDSDVRLPPESANGKSQDLTTNSVSAPWAKASTSHASTTRSSNSMSRRDFSLGCS